MKFDTLDDVPQKLERLKSIGIVWFDTEEVSFTDTFTGDDSGRYMVVSPKEQAKLTAVYKKAYYAYTQIACEPCREHRLIVLETELSILLHTMEIKYG